MSDVRCLDCRLDLMPDTPIGSKDWQRYMVHDDVWADAGMTPNGGWLCVRCLQARLGRLLTGADFPHLPLNDPGRDDDEPILEALASRWPPPPRRRGLTVHPGQLTLDDDSDERDESMTFPQVSAFLRAAAA